MDDEDVFPNSTQWEDDDVFPEDDDRRQVPSASTGSSRRWEPFQTSRIEEIPIWLDPRKRRRVAAQAKWLFLAFIVFTACFLKAVAWRQWAPMNSFINASRPWVVPSDSGAGEPKFQARSATGDAKRPATSDMDVLATMYGFQRGDLRSLADYLRELYGAGYPPRASEPVRFIPDRITGELPFHKIFARVEPGSIPLEKRIFDWLGLAVFLAAMLAAAVPGFFSSSVRAHWRDPVDAIRDWVVVGVATAFLSTLGFAAIRSLPNAPRSLGIFNAQYVMWSAPVLIGSAWVGFAFARRMAISRRALGSSSNGYSGGRLLLQSLLVPVAYMPIRVVLDDRLVRIPGADILTGTLALAVLIGAMSILLPAWAADKRLHKVQGGTRGVMSGDRPLELLMTLVGGKSAGKTVFLAGAFYQWTQDLSGRVEIQSVPPSDEMLDEFQDGDSDLEEVANRLYAGEGHGYSRFPQGTATTRSFGLQLLYRTDTNEKVPVVSFTMLDYPGGVLEDQPIRGANPGDNMFGIGADMVESVRNFLNMSDAVLYVEDMSAARRGRRAQDALQLNRTVKAVLQAVALRSGNKRIVPLAIVMTKCDEFTNEHGEEDRHAIERCFRSTNGPRVINIWQELCKSGPGFDRTRKFRTSAITQSKPQKDSDGQPDLGLPFIPDEPPPIRPGNCLDPLLWICREAMHWNVTAFADIKGFLIGSQSRSVLQQDAIEELDRLLQLRKIS